MKKTILWLSLSAAAVVLLAEWTDNGHIWQGLRECYFRGYRDAKVDDLPFKKFRTIPASEAPRAWPLHDRFTSYLPDAVRDSTEAYGTVALAVVHRDSLLLDWTSDQVDGADTMRTNAFSMAIRQVRQMRRGIPFGESYRNPVGFMARSTYGHGILERTASYNVNGEAGVPWKYQGGNTLILQEVLLSLIDMPLGIWFAETIWQPLGAAEDAAWAVDDQGHERNYCCFYSRATEYARLGQLLLDTGRVDSVQLIDRAFMEELMTPVGLLPDGDDIQHYGYQVWMGTHRGHAFTSMQGLHGQYIVAVPDLDLVAVRTGFDRPKGKLRHIDGDVYNTLNLAFDLAGSR